jgi:rhodanese-related sulfurtransferase
MRAVVLAAVLGLGLMVGGLPAYSFNLSTMLGNAGGPHYKTFKLIHVNDLKNLLDDPKAKVHLYDANVPSTRSKFGVIPGATLLASGDDYPLSMLPQDKDAKLVFYCANTHCMESHEAARRALNAGYRDVNVMAEGITGWKSAGETTVPVASAQSRSS